MAKTKWTNTYYATVDIPTFAYCHIGIHVQADSMSEAVDMVSETMEGVLVPEVYEQHVITRIERLDSEELAVMAEGDE